MHNRIFGLETEYGLLIKSDQSEFSPSWIAHRIIDHLFATKKYGVIDVHYRGYDEPPGNGGFLLNAGRMYVDMGHLEFASPECHSLWDMLTYDRAGDCLIQDCLDDLGIADQVSIIKNNVDHETGATFGCHENFLVSRDFPFTQRGLGKLIPFLVTRQVFTGAGRVGMTRNLDGWIELEDIEGITRPRSKKPAQNEMVYQISQRPDFIVNDFFEWVQHNRAIVNTRDEPLADPNRFRRLHLLVGDSNMAEEATLLKMGTTGLVLQLIEEGHAPQGLDLDDPVQTLRDISRDPTRQWFVTLSTGQYLSALEMQEIFWEAAAKRYAGQDEETDWVLAHWESVIKDLHKGYQAVVGRVDWASKLWLLENFREAEKLEWDDPWLKSLDLEYHNVDPARGLYHGLADEGQAPRFMTDEAVRLAKFYPPRNTRAFARGEAIRYLTSQAESGFSCLADQPEDHRVPPYVINWSVLQFRGSPVFVMADPFRTYVQESRDYCAESSSRPSLESLSNQQDT
ncbi:MAG: proteasome accessory factor PafA2 family protein [Nitrospirales bacterium]